jgi:hypothetical protein
VALIWLGDWITDAATGTLRFLVVGLLCGLDGPPLGVKRV